MKRSLYLIFLVILASCGSDAGNILVTNNFDGLQGWGVEHPSLTSERAHSGKYSLKIDGSQEYSLAFNQVLGTLTSKKPKKILVELWAYIPSEGAKGVFVCSVTNPTTNQATFWQGFNLVDKTEDYRQWVKLSKRLELPDAIQLSDKFSCYLWRPESAGEPVFIDDLKITVLE